MRLISGTEASVPALLAAVREAGAGMILVEAPPSLTGSATIPATLSELVAHAPCPVLTFPVLRLDHNHPDLHVLSGLHCDSGSVLSVGVD
jgi:hypothetical protein